MISFSEYSSDIRVRREAEALYNNGFDVDVISLPNDTSNTQYKLNDVNIIPITNIRFFSHRGNPLKFLIGYLLFGLTFFFKLFRLNKSHRYNIIHVHNPPDPFVFFAFPLKILFKIKIVLDRHEPLYLGVKSLFGTKSNSFIINLIKLIENISFKLSDKIIVINRIEFLDVKNRGINEDRIAIVTNTLDESRIEIDPNTLLDRKSLLTKVEENTFVILYQGLIALERDLDTLLEAVKKIVTKNKKTYLKVVVCGAGPYLSELIKYVQKNELESFFEIKGKIEFNELVKYMKIADLGLVLAKDNEFYNRYSPNKIFEYLYFNKLVIVPKLALLYSIAKDACFFYKPSNADELALRITEIMENYGQLYSDKSENMKKFYNENSWDNVKKNLINCYKELM
jgi:glycosyltransferase involved in cell wall biosynthesis